MNDSTHKTEVSGSSPEWSTTSFRILEYGDKPIYDILASDIREYLSYVKCRYHLSWATVQRYKVTSQISYHWVVD